MGKVLQLNETLAHMAALIRENPSITVREIANEMRFADNKSVYYWLGKANFKGIQDFKKNVLGTDSSTVEGISVEMNRNNYFLLKVPLRSWRNIKKEDGPQWYYFLHQNPNPRGIFAIQIETNDFTPWFFNQDILVIDTLQDYQQGMWVLLKQGRNYSIGRVGNQGQIFEPNTFAVLKKSKYKILGVIINQHRRLNQNQ